MYSDNNGYKKFPELTLMISKHPVKFLVDSGATNSVLRVDALPQHPKKSGRTCVTIGSSGVPTTENCSVPLRCELDNRVIKHSFLVSQNCPVNLLGRDLMCRFNIVLNSTLDGVEVSRNAHCP